MWNGFKSAPWQLILSNLIGIAVPKTLHLENHIYIPLFGIYIILELYGHLS